MTGESVPVDKSPVPDVAAAAASPDLVDSAARVFAGTINGAGALEIQVTRLAEDSTLARVVRLVAEAQTKTTSTQRFTDRFQRIFVPAVLVGVFLLLFAGIVVNEPFTATVYRRLPFWLLPAHVHWLSQHLALCFRPSHAPRGPAS